LCVRKRVRGAVAPAAGGGAGGVRDETGRNDVRATHASLAIIGTLALLLAGVSVLHSSSGLASVATGAAGAVREPPQREAATPAIRLPALALWSEHATATPIAPTPGPAQTPPADPTTPTPASGPDGFAVVGSEKGQAITLIDTKTNQATETISVGAPVSHVAIQPDGRLAWVFSATSGQLDFYVVDLIKGELEGTTRLGDAPGTVAFSADGTRAYVGLTSGNAVSFLDADPRKEIGRVQLGNQSPGVEIRRRTTAMATLRRPSGETLFVAGQGSGVVWALDAGSAKLLAEIEVGGGPTHLVASPDQRHLYVLADTLDQVIVIDPATLRVAARIPVPGRPSGVAVDGKGVVYVTDADSGGVWLVDPNAQKVLMRIQVGGQPSDIAASPHGERVYVTNRADGTVSVMDTVTRSVIETVRVGVDPVAVAFATRPSQPSAAPIKPSTTKPTPTPTMVPSPTPLPPNTRPPGHLPVGTRTETFVPNAAFAGALAFAPDGRLFYDEVHTGKIRVVQEGKLLPDPFYTFVVSGEPEAGLLGLTLDPDFAHNHFVYVYYTSVAGDVQTTGGPNGPNQIVRLTDVKNHGTNLTPIVRDLPSGPIHNSGTLRFGPDGKLYVSVGDNDHIDNAQNLGTLAGKILRYNPDGSIPSDNPFVGQVGRLPAIWAYGFRNSFSFDFQPIGHGLFATENGPGDHDEINLVVKGGNYGWPPSGFQDKPGLIDPLMSMNPTIGPTGLTFYVGKKIPEWQNDLFYCNYHQGQLRRIHLAPASLDRIVFEEVVVDGCTLNLATGPDGALYFSDLNAIYRIRPPDGSDLLATVTPGPAPLGTPTTTLPAGTRPQDRDVGVTLVDGSLTPSRTVLPAGMISFQAENLGSTVHALRVVGPGVDVTTEPFGPRQSRRLEVKLGPGTYQLLCPIASHAQMGMKATITVVGP
jgi:aldose sugar dehydrogenase